MYRSALVALKPDASNDMLMAYAVDVAKRASWRLAGIAILDRDLIAPPEPVPLGGMSFKQERDASRIADTRELARVALADFAARCEAAGVEHRTESCEDSLQTELAHAVQCHDILLLGHTTGTVVSSEPGAHSVLPSILRRNSRPAIVVPAIRPQGESVVVAFDGSVQAARALAAFVGAGIEADAPVHVVSFHADLAAAQKTASLAESFLSSHGLQVTCHPSVQPSAAYADRILAACLDCQARLLVMGACAKSTAWEFVFGSVTKQLLAEATQPILLDH